MTSNKELYGDLSQSVVPQGSPTLELERYLVYLYSIQDRLDYWPVNNPPRFKFLRALEEEVWRVEQVLYG